MRPLLEHHADICASFKRPLLVPHVGMYASFKNIKLVMTYSSKGISLAHIGDELRLSAKGMRRQHTLTNSGE